MKNKIYIRKIAVTAILSGVSAVLMYLSFPVILVPSFLKMDFSELPALIAAFSLGPIYGAIVCFIKNLINLPFSTTAMVGELVNFLIGISFVLPAGIIYKRMKTKRGAIIGAVAGAFIMAILSVPINYFISYPMYAKLYAGGDMSVIISAYTAIYSEIDTLIEALVYCNLPFTFAKGFFNILLTVLIYKRISPFLKSGTKSAT